MGVLTRTIHALSFDATKHQAAAPRRPQHALLAAPQRHHVVGLPTRGSARLPLPTRSLAGKVSLADRDEQLPSLATLKRAAQTAGDELIGTAADRRAANAAASTSNAATNQLQQQQQQPTQQQIAEAKAKAAAAAAVQAGLPLPIPAVPSDVLNEFEHKLEADVATVGVTIVAILGVITFWRGVWALLDHYIGDSVFGDVCCVIVGLSIILYIRLSGYRIASFWPNS